MNKKHFRNADNLEIQEPPESHWPQILFGFSF